MSPRWQRQEARGERERESRWTAFLIKTIFEGVDRQETLLVRTC